MCVFNHNNKRVTINECYVTKLSNDNCDSSSRVLLTLILFLGRGVIAGLFQAAYVYTPEVYPTNLRSIGGTTTTNKYIYFLPTKKLQKFISVGGCSSLARLGAMW